jgi:ribosome-associated protein
MNDLPVPPYCTIISKELITQVSTSSGPGGQHVNKTSTKVTLRWNVSRSTSINERQRILLTTKLAKKLNKNNEVVVHCDSTRSQHTNHIKVRKKLVQLLSSALFKPKKRKKTRPTRGSIERRIKEKKRRSEIKKGRSSFK